mmetsp:Transcript_81634/g.264474  ORF Transcript_81634/g.264474 Transcript_81634/m.264474 type:complete len:211 (+) Transcript_81634:435-1067(+)
MPQLRGEAVRPRRRHAGCRGEAACPRGRRRCCRSCGQCRGGRCRGRDGCGRDGLRGLPRVARRAVRELLGCIRQDLQDQAAPGEGEVLRGELDDEVLRSRAAAALCDEETHQGGLALLPQVLETRLATESQKPRAEWSRQLCELRRFSPHQGGQRRECCVDPRVRCRRRLRGCAGGTRALGVALHIVGALGRSQKHLVATAEEAWRLHQP